MNNINIPFTKVEGVGNHFMLLNALEMPEMDWPALAERMSRPRFGVGSDGLLVLLPSERADFRLRMFNPDGSEDACGNGLRCAAVYVRALGLSRSREIVFEAWDGLRHAEIVRAADGSSVVRVNMGRPSLRPANLGMSHSSDYPLDIGGRIYRITAVMMSTPHAVICAPVQEFWESLPPVSSEIEVLPIFPERTSVTWCSIESPDSLAIRTWERGVGPTLGCGTGACAALVAANLRGLADKRAKVTSPGGTLDIEWPDAGDIFMSGPANIVFEGEWSIADA